MKDVVPVVNVDEERSEAIKNSRTINSKNREFAPTDKKGKTSLTVLPQTGTNLTENVFATNCGVLLMLATILLIMLGTGYSHARR